MFLVYVHDIVKNQWFIISVHDIGYTYGPFRKVQYSSGQWCRIALILVHLKSLKHWLMKSSAQDGSVAD